MSLMLPTPIQSPSPCPIHHGASECSVHGVGGLVSILVHWAQYPLLGPACYSGSRWQGWCGGIRTLADICRPALFPSMSGCFNALTWACPKSEGALSTWNFIYTLIWRNTNFPSDLCKAGQRPLAGSLVLLVRSLPWAPDAPECCKLCQHCTQERITIVQ